MYLLELIKTIKKLIKFEFNIIWVRNFNLSLKCLIYLYLIKFMLCKMIKLNH
jgi:hypothetical protein